MLLFSGEVHDFLISVGPGEDDRETEIDKLAANYKQIRVEAVYDDIFGCSSKTSRTINFRDYIAGIKGSHRLMPVDEIHNIRRELEKIRKDLAKK